VQVLAATVAIALDIAQAAQLGAECRRRGRGGGAVRASLADPRMPTAARATATPRRARLAPRSAWSASLIRPVA
jgi:hypothetical protein